MTPSNKRSEWVDFAKGFAILAVVLLHIDFPGFDSSNPPLREFLGGAWHVAVFFLLGGFFMKEEKVQKAVPFIKGKLKTLYLPLLYFYIPAVLLHNVMVGIGWYDTSADYFGKSITLFSFTQMLKEVVLSICLAGREPILGAMWFVYVMFMAFCGLAIVSCVLKKFFKDDAAYTNTKCLALLLLAIGGSTLTNQVGINIPRFNNVLTAMWLIHCGYWIRNKFHCEFNNLYVFIGALALFFHLVFNESVWVALNSNKFSDLAVLTSIAVSALYVICFIGRKIESNSLAKVVTYCGRESFYIMALQFVGFKVGVYIANALGFESCISALMPQTGGSLALLALFFVCGAAFPCFFMFIFRLVKTKVLYYIYTK